MALGVIHDLNTWIQDTLSGFFAVVKSQCDLTGFIRSRWAETHRDETRAYVFDVAHVGFSICTKRYD